MPNCYVPWCKSSSWRRLPNQSPTSVLSFHLFPKSTGSEWLRIIGRDPLSTVISQRICSLHFKEEDFGQKGKQKIVKPNVMPSVNIPNPVDNPNKLVTVKYEDDENDMRPLTGVKIEMGDCDSRLRPDASECQSAPGSIHFVYVPQELRATPGTSTSSRVRPNRNLESDEPCADNVKTCRCPPNEHVVTSFHNYSKPPKYGGKNKMKKARERVVTVDSSKVNRKRKWVAKISGYRLKNSEKLVKEEQFIVIDVAHDSTQPKHE